MAKSSCPKINIQVKSNFSNCTLFTSCIRLGLVFALPIHDCCSVFSTSVADSLAAGRRCRELSLLLAACVPSRTRLARRGYAARHLRVAASSFRLPIGIPSRPRLSSWRRGVASGGTRWGQRLPAAGPLTKKEPAIGRPSSTNNGSFGPILYFFFLQPLPLLRTLETEVLWLLGDKRIEDLGVLVKKARYGGRHTLPYRVLRPCCQVFIYIR